MASPREKRLQRLVEVRNRQRDEVGTAVQKARATRDEHDALYREAVEAVHGELRATKVNPLEAIDPEIRQLQIECLIAAQMDAALREGSLKTADEHLVREIKRLSAAHAKVRQMEILALAQRKADIARADKVEQKESDDLSATKESHK
ncbi:MAG: hypothetical protein MUC50_06305 [Myxococcota bacterium]|jgi:hypothetical protein|nr:hypothetical protein [Myxococcota bacterium]